MSKKYIWSDKKVKFLASQYEDRKSFKKDYHHLSVRNRVTKKKVWWTDK